MWEYQRLEFEINKLIDLNIKLTELGKNNWEVIYYNEIKPERFGNPYKIIILIKRNIT